MFDARVWKGRGRRLGAWAAVGVILAGTALGAETRKFEGHSDATTGVAFFVDGRRAASCGDGSDRTVRIWELATGRELRRFTSDAGLTALAVSPDGKSVLAAGRDHVIRLWMVDGPPNAKPKRWEGHGDVVNHLAFAPNGKVAASTSWDGTARLWDVATGKVLRKLEGHQGSVNGVSFSPDGRRLATGGADHTVRIWDAATGKETRKFEGHAGWVGDVAFAPDGRRVASAGGRDEPVVILWDASTGAVVRRIDAPPDAGWGVAFAGGARLLVVESDAVAVFDVATGRKTNRLAGHAGQVHALAASADGRRFLSAGADKTVRLWDLPSPELVARTVASSPAPATRDSFGKAAEIRAKLDADRDGNVELQDAFMEALRAAAPALAEVPVGSEKRPSTYTRLALNSRRLGFDGLRFKAPADGGRRDLKWEFIMPAVKNERGRAMKFWYIAPLTGQMRGFTGYELGKDEPIEGVDIPQKYRVIQGLQWGEIRPGAEYLIWFSFEAGTPEVPTYVKVDLVPPSREVRERIAASAAALKRSVKFPEPVHAACFAPDGKRILAASNSALYGAELETGRIQKRWDGSGKDPRTAAFSLDGKLGAVGCGDGKVRIVDVDAGKELHVCEGHSGAVRCVAFLPDGKRVVSGGEDRAARLWDVATGKQVRTFEGHTDQVLCLAVSPDGRRIVTGPSIEDKVARVWDVATGRLVAKLEGNTEAVYSLAYSADGKTVLTGGEDASLRLFDPASGRQIRQFKPNSNERVHATAFLSGGKLAVSGGDDEFLSFWSVERGRYLRAYETASRSFAALVPSAGGPFLSVGGDGVVALWTPPRAEASPEGPTPTQADLDYLKPLSWDLEQADLTDLAELKDLTINVEEGIDDAGLEHLSRLVNLESLSINRTARIRGPGLAHLAKLPKLTKLNLSDGLSDKAVARLAPLKGLTSLSLDRTGLRDSGMSALKGMTALTHLSLNETKVTDAGLTALKGMVQMEWLSLGYVPVRGPGLANLKGMSRLKTLSFVSVAQFEKSPLTDAGLVHLENLPALDHLNLDQSSVTDAGMASLRKLKALKRLSIAGTRVADAGLAQLAGHPGIAELYLHGSKLTDAGLKSLKGMKSLTNLNLRATEITDAGLAHLAGMDKLEGLDLGYIKRISDEGIKHLKGLKGLKSLDLVETNVSDRSIPIIGGFERLEFLNARDSKITEAGEEQLRKLLPKLDIDHG